MGTCYYAGSSCRGTWAMDGGDFSKYKVLILPEAQRPDVALRKRFARFLGIGGLYVFEL